MVLLKIMSYSKESQAWILGTLGTRYIKLKKSEFPKLRSVSIFLRAEANRIPIGNANNLRELSLGESVPP
jgi:hypothetical protein